MRNGLKNIIYPILMIIWSLIIVEYAEANLHFVEGSSSVASFEDSSLPFCSKNIREGGLSMKQNDNNPRELEDLEQFFNVLHGPNPIDAYQVIYTLPDKQIHTFRPGQLSYLKGILSAIRLSNHMYYGVCLQHSVPPKGKRGSADTTIAMPGLWFDLDIKGPNHKEDHYPESNEIALDFVNNLPWKPTILVNSGNGYQLLYLFEKPWIFISDEDRSNAKNLSERFQGYIKSVGQKHGWRLDSTQDLARILRIPGTLNHKNIPPKQVEVVEYNQDARYEIKDFDNLPDIRTKPAKDSKSASSNASSDYEPWTGPPALIKTIYDNCGWPTKGVKIIELPRVGGLHYRYEWKEAA